MKHFPHLIRIIGEGGKKMDTYSNDEIEFFLHEYGNMVYRLAYINVKTKEQAEDILQDVFLKLMQQTTRLDSNEHLRAWLLRTTINCCKDHWKSAWFKRRVSMNEVPETTYTQAAVFNSGTGTTTPTGFVTERVKMLPAKYKQIIHLYYYEEYNLKEIAGILQINENTVRTRIVRGRELLKKYLGEEAHNYEF